MKAKEWVAVLLPLMQDPVRSEEFLQQVELLAKECNELLIARLKGINFRWRRNADERVVAAFREASVKWEAVVHAIQIKLGEPPTFPLMRGAVLLPHVTRLIESLDDKKLSPSEAREEYNFLMLMASRLGYRDEKWLTVMLDMLNERVTMQSVGMVQDFAIKWRRYGFLARAEINDDGTFTERDREELRELESWLVQHRPMIRESLHALSPQQKMAALLSIGTVFAERAVTR